MASLVISRWAKLIPNGFFEKEKEERADSRVQC